MLQQRFFIFLLLTAVVAALAWLVVPEPVAVRPTLLSEAPWKLPVQQTFIAKDTLTILNSANLWGKLADISQSSEAEPEWRFIGAIARGSERQVIVKRDNQPEQSLAVGDTLPGGSKILSIENDRICLLINGEKRSLYIYPHGQLSGKMSYLAEETPNRRTANNAAQHSP